MTDFKCAKCEVFKMADEFHWSPSTGKRRSQCKGCRKIESRQNYEKSRESILSRTKANRIKSKSSPVVVARLAEQRKKKEQLSSVKAYRKEYRKQPEVKDRARARAATPEALQRRAERARMRRASDAKFRLGNRISCAIKSCLRRGKQGKSWTALVEFTLDEFMLHIERQFSPGMSWGNIGEWHIDHILPISSFDYECPDDGGFKACWHLSNLRPLWAKQNLSKRDKILFLL